MGLSEPCEKHELTGCAYCNPQPKKKPQPAEVTPQSRHMLAEVVEGFTAGLYGWCDAGDHKIEPGDLITRDGDWDGYVHVDCL